MAPSVSKFVNNEIKRNSSIICYLGDVTEGENLVSIGESKPSSQLVYSSSISSLDPTAS